MVHVHNNFILHMNFFFSIYLQLIIQVNLILDFYLELQSLPSTPLIYFSGHFM